MLGSNQRPLSCGGRSITSWLFAGVQNGLIPNPLERWRCADEKEQAPSPSCVIPATFSVIPLIKRESTRLAQGEGHLTMACYSPGFSIRWGNLSYCGKQLRFPGSSVPALYARS